MRFEKDGDVNFQLDKILNHGIELGDNVRGGFIEFTTTGGEELLQHNLGYTPIGWLVIYSDAPVTLHKGATEWNSVHLSLVSSVASVMVRLFVL